MSGQTLAGYAMCPSLLLHPRFACIQLRLSKLACRCERLSKRAGRPRVHQVARPRVFHHSQHSQCMPCSSFSSHATRV